MHVFIFHYVYAVTSDVTVLHPCIPSLKFVDLPFRKIRLIFGPGVSDMVTLTGLTFWSWNLCGMPAAARTTFLPMLVLLRPFFVVELWANMLLTYDVTLFPWPLTFDLWPRIYRWCGSSYSISIPSSKFVGFPAVRVVRGLGWPAGWVGSVILVGWVGSMKIDPRTTLPALPLLKIWRIFRLSINLISLDLWAFDLYMGSRVSRVVGFLHASFQLATPFHFRLRVRHGTDRGTGNSRKLQCSSAGSKSKLIILI